MNESEEQSCINRSPPRIKRGEFGHKNAAVKMISKTMALRSLKSLNSLLNAYDTQGESLMS